MSVPKQAVILCGGRGERLRPLTDSCPKPLMPCNGLPFLDHLLGQLHGQGVRECLLLAGHLAKRVAEYVVARNRIGGRPKLACVESPASWGTAQRLWGAWPFLNEQFLLLYGDNYAPVSLSRLAAHHREAAGQSLPHPLTVTACPKARGNLRVTGRWGAYSPSRVHDSYAHVDVGYMLAERDRLKSWVRLRAEGGAGDFADVLSDLGHAGQLAAFAPGCSYQSISDPARLALAEQYFKPRKVLLLDRDGVLNAKAPPAEYVLRPEELRWLEHNVRALEVLARQGFEFLVLTNQPAVGRGLVSRGEVDGLHAWMVAQLALRGVVIKEVLVCPHGWGEGCACRKPLPGLFFQAERRHNLRLDRVLYVGDGQRDLEAAAAAGGAGLLVGEGQSLLARLPEVRELYSAWGIL